MPRLSRWFVKAGLIYFVAALLLAAADALWAWLSPQRYDARVLYPVVLHFFMVGWIAQLIFGVAHWMFPRRSREAPRGNERVAVAVFATLNAGLLLRGIAEPAFTIAPSPLWRGTLLLSGLLQLSAAILFLLLLWPRVRGSRK